MTSCMTPLLEVKLNRIVEGLSGRRRLIPTEETLEFTSIEYVGRRDFGRLQTHQGRWQGNSCNVVHTRPPILSKPKPRYFVSDADKMSSCMRCHAITTRKEMGSRLADQRIFLRLFIEGESNRRHAGYEKSETGLEAKRPIEGLFLKATVRGIPTEAPWTEIYLSP